MFGYKACNLSFGIITNKSTLFSNFSKEYKALSHIFAPSAEKGHVHIAITKVPIFFAISATTGAVPPPVPPPRPQVINTTSEPSIAFFNSCSDSFAASSPL
jgi:hypothetical protein